MRVLKDINLNVVSAEIETEGPLAKDEFFITYHGGSWGAGSSWGARRGSVFWGRRRTAVSDKRMPHLYERQGVC